MKNLKRFCGFLILISSLSTFSCAQNLNQQFDEMLKKQYPSSGPGATVLVAINGEITYLKAFGKANLELDIHMEDDMVFEIGSITKQFTAVSILMLMEQGKLNLDDDITKFLSDYPTNGHHINIHHLLTHTSGIKSYTSMERWASVWRKDFQPKELIDFFKDEPMDFTPGSEFRYNNSAYVILGYIIEKLSGQTYGEFIEANIFKPLGMNSSFYGSNSKIIKKRASGYQKRLDFANTNYNFVNAEFISLTQPYAAGSIMSTVQDLFLWNRAIRSNQLIKEESIALAFTDHKLNNGVKTNYGYGWFLREINGDPSIEHAGGIFGYISNSIYLPKDDIFVVVLTNCDCNDPGAVSKKMATVVSNGSK